MDHRYPYNFFPDYPVHLDQTHLIHLYFLSRNSLLFTLLTSQSAHFFWISGRNMPVKIFSFKTAEQVHLKLSKAFSQNYTPGMEKYHPGCCVCRKMQIVSGGLSWKISVTQQTICFPKSDRTSHCDWVQAHCTSFSLKSMYLQVAFLMTRQSIWMHLFHWDLQKRVCRGTVWGASTNLQLRSARITRGTYGLRN